MSKSIQIRPKYSIPTELPPNLIADEVSLMLNESNDINGRIINNNIYLSLTEDNLHYWSPVLNVKINKADNGSLIKGFAGPNPKVWATFMVFYGLAIMLLIFGGSLGISQMMLGIDSYWIWSVPVSIVLFAFIFIAAKYGQYLGAEQLLELSNFLDGAILSAENKNGS
ncbi:MAG: hypothetical protein QM503_01035 [Bacteroidota bacterium]